MNKHLDVIALRRDGAAKKKGYWKEEERKLFIKMYNEGAGITELALQFGRSESAIMNQVDKLGLNPRVRASRKEKLGCLCKECSLYDTCNRKEERCEEDNCAPQSN